MAVAPAGKIAYGRWLEACQIQRGTVVFPLPWAEGPHGHSLRLHACLARRKEGLADGFHQGRGRERVPPVVADKAPHAPFALP